MPVNGNSKGRSSAVGRFSAVLAVVGVCGATMLAFTQNSVAATTGTVQGSRPDCSVQLTFTSTSVTADIRSGCKGGDFYLTSWTTRSNVPATSHPQVIFASTNRAPWTVPLPQCYWQVDFARRSTPPPMKATNRELVVGRLGGAACKSGPTTTTTTVATTTTTVPKTTTTVHVTTTTSTTSTTVKTTTPPHSTTTTTAAVGTTTTVTPTAGGPPDGPTPAGPTTPATSSHGGLAFTGFEALMTLFIALALIGCGIAAVLAARRARSTPPDTV
jgi:hypothetical protein